ncbi:SigB/SigF/SigG family RNA polymerase sigma factor [Actinomarinicola tropica]|uniref:SigB/SigF/SigG family RNA polymerase sigma factor n=1 Tax=Actinomarinicola tropica TaxID=2789776 RepID=UPI001898954B|nr:SigB/SigF/SigG family RNA polymerase sigma factor [Actinomarinicola tropica]
MSDETTRGEATEVPAGDVGTVGDDDAVEVEVDPDAIDLPGAAADTDPRFAEYRRTKSRRLRNQLIEDHRHVAERVARRFPNRSLAWDDVFQVAQLGLLKAVERFDPERGFKFTTFAEPTISGELKRHFRDHAWDVRIPRRAHDMHQAVKKMADEMTNELGRAPRIQEIAERLGVTPDDVMMALEADSARRAASLSAPIGSDDDGGSLGEQLGEHDASLERAADRMTVLDLVAKLPEREREIVRLRFEENLSQAEIGERIGISQMHVSRLLRRTLTQLRETIEAE